MTDLGSPRAAPEPGKARRPSTAATTVSVTAAAIAVSAVIATGLTAQMAHGRDPVLGPKLEAARAADAAQSAEERALAAAAAPAPAPPPAPVVTRSS